MTLSNRHKNNRNNQNNGIRIELGSVVSNIVHFLNRNILVYLLLLTGLLTVLFFGFRKLNVDENIYSIFPQGEEFKKFNTILKENNLNKQVIFSIDAKGKDSYTLQSELDSIGNLLKAETNGHISEIEVFKEDREQAVLDYYYDHFPALLENSDYVQIQSKLHQDSIKKSLGEVRERMTSVNAFFLRKILAKDPLGLAWEKLSELNPSSDSTAMKVEDGILFSSNGDRALFTGVLNFELDNNLKNEELNRTLIALKKKINQSNEKIGFDYFGTFQISYENSRQVKEDTYVTMLISIGLILLLLILYYRSILTPLFFILPAIFAGFSGLGLVGYFHTDISAISIATSAVLMGIVLDYSFHFFTHYSHSGNLKQTVKELAFPMMVGSFTTVVAFSALMFTDSVVLQNFGLIALCTLSSAVVFTLFLLPTLIHVLRYKPKVRKADDNKSFKAPRWLLRLSIFSILILTVLFIFRSNEITFDSDLNNLSFHTDELVQKEEFFTGINPKEEKKLHLFVSGKTEKEAMALNYELYGKLKDYKNEYGLEEIISVGPYAIPEVVKTNGFERWSSFWDKNLTPTLNTISENAPQYGFTPTAFQPFENWAKQKEPSFSPEESQELRNNLGLSRLVYHNEQGWNVISSVVVKKSDLEHFKSEVRALEGVYIFDVSGMANALMTSVQNDFNYLLIFSALLVFFSLFVIYGRIELALFSFFPMVISWIWILGIASSFDIQFNFVNIIVATFIFGLGDDFSIFVTDGLIQMYKSKSNALKSYKSAIILSGITTIIGTGALYFSKHPAIHSIAVISVVGIGCIMLVTLLIQPYVFRFFVTNRTEQKKSPMTFLGLIFSLVLFSYFFIGCLIINIFLLLMIPLPIAKKKKRNVLNVIVSNLAKSTLYLGVHVKKRIVNPERLDFSKPAMIVANHSSFLDILLMIMLNPKIVIMVKKWVYNSPVFGFFIRYSGYLFIEEGTEYNMDLLKSRINDGYSIMIFPEGTRSKDGEIKRFHKGAFFMAKELNLDIQPIIIVGAHYVNPKNDIIIKAGSLILVVLERIKTTDEMYNQRFGVLAKEMTVLMREAFSESKLELENADYLKNRVVYNYLYKSPITEWYVRIKWKFERHNFDFYDKIIGDRKQIYDIGTGLGYLSYFLHYRNPKREIVGIDYDDEKIAIAANGYDKSEKLQFEVGDVRDLKLQNADVVFFNDVLHYLGQIEQMEVLNKTADSLNDEGVIFIRDGITDLADRHSVTKRTEKYSTKIVNFNKISGDLWFFSSKDIFNFAKERNLHYEMIEQSKKTSNVLFILRKIKNEGIQN